jgi:hypothetical protein
MKFTGSKSRRKVYIPKRGFISIVLIFILFGALLIAISLHLPQEGNWGYLRELLKEFGIVVLAVFAVSLIYELTIAKKYMGHFTGILREQIQQGESNAAICAHLGIIQIFPTRYIFEIKYPFQEMISPLTVGASLRIVARSLFNIMTKTGAIQEALERGSLIEFCLLDPSASSEIEKSPDLAVGDIQTALDIFRRDIVNWVITKKPQGQIIIRYHKIPLLDSFVSLNSSTQRFCLWDLSFGRDLASKQILLLDPDKPLGKNLLSRYSFVWSKAVKVFEYDGKTITTSHFIT